MPHLRGASFSMCREETEQFRHVAAVGIPNGVDRHGGQSAYFFRGADPALGRAPVVQRGLTATAFSMR